MSYDSLPSPCISVCALDPATGLCLGCYRNRQEIKAWRGMTEAQQKAMLPCLHARRAALGGGARQKRLTARALAKQASLKQTSLKQTSLKQTSLKQASLKDATPEASKQ